MCIVAISFFLDNHSPFKLLVLGTCLIVLEITLLFIVIDDINSIRMISMMDGIFVKCKWCRSYYPFEIINTINLFLNNKKIQHKVLLGFHHSTGFFNAKLIKPQFIKKTIISHPHPPIAQFILENENCSITILKDGDWRNIWIYISGKNFENNFVADLKNNIIKMGNNNMFCRICNGKDLSTCYGPRYSKAFKEDVKSLEKLIYLSLKFNVKKFEDVLIRKQQLNDETYYGGNIKDEINFFQS